jgi:hypothetical protein
VWGLFVRGHVRNSVHMATQTIEYYQELYEASLPYEGDLTKCQNALKAKLMLREIKARSMGSAGSNLQFAADDEEIKRLQTLVSSLTKSSSGRSFTRVRCIQS